MGIWKIALIGLLTLILISVIVYHIRLEMLSKLLRGCIVIDESICKITDKELSQNVTEIYLCYSKLILSMNTQYTSHWSIIAKTSTGYYSISSSSYMAMFISKCYKKNIKEDERSKFTSANARVDEKKNKNSRTKNIGSFIFFDSRWMINYIPEKLYTLKTEIKLYNLTRDFCKYLIENHRGKYSLLNHNCHQVTSYIIKKYCNYSEDDKFIAALSGKKLVKAGIADVLTGPKVLV